MQKNSVLGGVVATAMMIGGPTPVVADEFIKGMMGAMIGAAIANGNQGKSTQRRTTSTKKKSSSGVSSAARAANREIQTALNYFGFPAGTPDGVLGRKSRSAISSYQACLGYPITGQLSPFEKDFLINSYHRGQAGGQQTMVTVARMPNGYCGLLQAYREEMARPVQPAAVPAPPVAAAAVPTMQPVQTAVQNTINVSNNSADMAKLQEEFDEIARQIELLTDVLSHQKGLGATASRSGKIQALEARISLFEGQRSDIVEEAEGAYQTPIRPTNANLGTTALRASEVFPKVPYYIAGTEQIGEFWVEPRITDEGYLVYNFNFLDPDAELAKVVEKISMSPSDIKKTVQGLEKVDEWTQVAQEKNIRRRFSKAAVCFPAADCEEKVAGNTSTEIVFLTYEDGKTAGQFRRNKGRSAATYNLSNESGMLLAAYLEYMLDVGSKEFEATTMTDDDLSAMFE